MSTLSQLRSKVQAEIGSYRTHASVAYKDPGSVGIETFAPQGVMGGSIFGQQRSNAQEYYQEFRGWVYVAINTIAKRAAGQAVIAAKMVKQEKAKRRLATSKVPTSYGQKLAPSYAYEMLEGHSIVRAFDNPNPVQGRWEFTYATVCSLYITGVFYWVGGLTEGTDGEQKLEVYTIPPHWMTPKHEGGLFTGYDLRMPNTTDPIPLQPEQVVRGCLPDPMNPLKGAISPLGTQLPAIRIDGKIQKSQEAGYDNGLFPHLAVSVGQDIGVDGRPLGTRPVLEGWQRQQIITAVRRLVGGVLNSNEPLILDGLIEKVFPIENKPREMDWIRSGDQVKRRIFQAFSLNPINAGEDVGANRAQAAVAEDHMCSATINPVLDIMSNKATNWAQMLYDDPSLMVWWAPCVPRDEDQRLKQNTMLAEKNAITKNELRAEYGLPPLAEEEGEKPAILETAAAMSSAVDVLRAMNLGELRTEEAIALFDVFFGEGQGERIVHGERIVGGTDGDGDEEEIEEDELPELDMDDSSRAAVVHLLAMVGGKIARKWSKGTGNASERQGNG